MAQTPTKELYARLRRRSCEDLWREEVPRFDRASPAVRLSQVALVRAIGVVFSERGTPAQKDEVRRWLTNLLRDPEEKIRRYAMTALPKLGAGSAEEAALLALLESRPCGRERKFVEESLNKIGGEATLQREDVSVRTQQKVQAAVTRRNAVTAIRLDVKVPARPGLRVHLRCRKGLEESVRGEWEDSPRMRTLFRPVGTGPGLVVIEPMAPFSLGDLYVLRCFATLGLVVSPVDNPSLSPDALAEALTTPLAQEILRTVTEGPIRYRLDFIDKGHQRGAIRQVAERVFARCPGMLNDARSAPWAVEIHAPGTVELRPRLRPDPRFAYRGGDVPAASHPPLAAALARLAGRAGDEVVWDPFCGSGLEVIESALLGGVKTLYGTDRSAEAIGIAEQNYRAAGLAAVPARFVVGDFRDFARALGRGSVSLIVTNPPLGRRVPIAGLRQLMGDLFFAAAAVLRPQGRLAFVNPLPAPVSHPALELLSRRPVDLGGFTCSMELYRRRS